MSSLSGKTQISSLSLRLIFASLVAAASWPELFCLWPNTVPNTFDIVRNARNNNIKSIFRWDDQRERERERERLVQRRLALPVGYCSSAHGLPGPGSHWQANRCPGPGRLSLSGRCQKSVSWSVTQSHGCPLAQSFSGSPACHRGSRRGGPGSRWRPVTAALIDRVSSYWQLESQVFKFLRWPKQTCPGLTGSSDYLNLAST